MAERVGFEPTLPCGKHAFQACAFSHSAISPAIDCLYEFNRVGRPVAHLAARLTRMNNVGATQAKECIPPDESVYLLQHNTV